MAQAGGVLRAYNVEEADTTSGPTRTIFDRRTAAIAWSKPASHLHSGTSVVPGTMAKGDRLIVERSVPFWM